MDPTQRLGRGKEDKSIKADACCMQAGEINDAGNVRYQRNKNFSCT